MGLGMLDVLIGLVTVFLTLSIVCSAIVEGVIQFFGVRGCKLRRAIADLLDSQAGADATPLTDKFYKRARIEALTSTNLVGRKRAPSYIEPATFAEVLLEVALDEGVAALGTQAGEALTAGGTPQQTRTLLTAWGDKSTQHKALAEVLLRFHAETGGDPARLRLRVAQWFTEKMDRLSGEFRRLVQVGLLAIALVLAFFGPVDTLHMVNTLHKNPALTAALVEHAGDFPMPLPPKPEGEGEAAGVPDPEAQRKYAEEVWKHMAEVLPSVIGSPEGGICELWTAGDREGALRLFLGRLISALAISMGAPFWFDALAKLMKIRGSLRPAPAPKEEGVGEAGTGGGAAPPLGVAAVGAPAAEAGVEAFGDPKWGFEYGVVGYSARNAFWLARAANLAYAPPAEIDVTLQGWGMRVAHYPAPGTKDPNGTEYFVAATDRVMIVAFRGTEPKAADWKTDAQAKLVDCAWRDGARVHAGFAQALDAAWEAFLQDVARLRQPGQSLWLTGHSLGGALALLAGARLAATEPGTPVAGVYTYGQPRAGDDAFAKFCAGALPDHHRHVHQRDVVPRIPPRLAKYQHSGQVHYFDRFGTRHADAAFWYRMLDFALFESQEDYDTRLPETVAALKDLVGDHGMRHYEQLTRNHLRL